ncbi:hypothetical protein AR687_04395 [Flavobacteriaceae bacterium CRH]|nr:hypothetical protein AR687_04395 [Flavobacteriaceae bacterium CRH]
MPLKKHHCQHLKNTSFFLLIAFIFFTSIISAQNDTLFFDANWKKCNKEIALYYRINPIKIKTKDAVGYKIKDLDSLYVINDYFTKSNKLQFEGYSTDKQARYLVGKAKWYNEDNTLLDSEDFKYKTYNKSKFEFPKWPILYLDYKIATKSQFIGGFEFCLDCETKNKLFLGLGFGVTSYNHTYYGLPDLHLSYNTPNFLFIKSGVSDKHAYALAGITVLNVLDLGFGYSQPFKKDEIPVIKGFTFGATFRLSSNQKAYTQLKFM